MRKPWWVAFASVLVITLGAFGTHLVLREPEPKEAAVVAEAAGPYSLNWRWASESLECQRFDACVHIAVDQTQLCPDQLEIRVVITDSNEDWVGNADMIVDSPKSAKATVIEVGVNRDDFEYFMVGDIWCYSGVPTAEAEL